MESLKKKEWELFKLDNILVPITSSVCAECPCPICHCAHYNPLGITGKKDVKNKPVINPDGGKMECETQPPVTGRGRSSSRGLCSICEQVTGCGSAHPCRPGDLKMVKQGNVDQPQSLVRNTKTRKRETCHCYLERKKTVHRNK